MINEESLYVPNDRVLEFIETLLKRPQNSCYKHFDYHFESLTLYSQQRDYKVHKLVYLVHSFGAVFKNRNEPVSL